MLKYYKCTLYFDATLQFTLNIARVNGTKIEAFQ